MTLSVWLVLVAGVLHGCLATLLENGGFEAQPDGLAGWVCREGCSLALSSDAVTGTSSAEITGRTVVLAGLAQSVEVAPGGSRYALTAQIKLLTLAPGSLYDDVQMAISCQSVANSSVYSWKQFGLVRRIRVGRWTKVGGFNHVAAGLHNCLMYVQVMSAAVDYLVDDMSLVELPELTDWRQEAENNIDTHRKADLTIRMKDSTPGEYTIEVHQKKHEFAFGAAVRAREIVNASLADYQRVFYENFEWAVFENAMKWKMMQWHKKWINYQSPNVALDELIRRGIKVRGHCVCWDVPHNVAYWLKELPPAEVREEVTKRINGPNGVVSVFKGRVEHWDVNNENLHGDWFEQTLNDPEVMSDMFREVNAEDSTARLFINDFGILQSNMALGLRNQAIYLQETGVPIHAVGIQSHLKPSLVDMTLMKHRLDAVAEAQLPMWITEVTVDEANVTLRAQVLDDIMTMYFGHVAVEGIVLWGFWDKMIWRDDAALFNGPNLTPNEAGTRFLSLMQKWRTNESLVLNETGSTTIRAFKGEYSVVVKKDGVEVKTESFTLNQSHILEITV